jgi:hypothetical protein
VKYEDWIRHYVPVVKARYVRDYRIWLQFKDGVEGEVDLSRQLWGEICEPLLDIEYFKKFKVKNSTIEWPNGADFAPEFLHLSVLGLLPPSIRLNRSRRAAAAKGRRGKQAKRSVPRRGA